MTTRPIAGTPGTTPDASRASTPTPFIAGHPRGEAPSPRELGLDLALIVARYLCKTEHLHYGYWPADLPTELGNLKEAQENYTDLLVRQIPENVETILEVGIGSGALTHRLRGAGYQVDCVSPSPYLTERARVLLGPEQQIFECKYEDLKTTKRYDLILFSESFQYIRQDLAFSVSKAHLASGGFLLISDFFRKETPEDGPIKGGHRLKDFRSHIEEYALQVLVDEDITAETAPNLDLLNDFSLKVIQPVKERLFGFLAWKHPLPFRALYWLLRKHIRHAEGKYLSGKRNGAAFLNYKSYRLMLLQQGSR